MKKRLFAILMSLTLVLTFMPAIAFAEGEGDIGSEYYSWRVVNDFVRIYYYEGDDSVVLAADDYVSYDEDAPELTYQWYKDMASLDDEDYDWSELTGETDAQLEVPAEEAYYKCELFDESTGASEYIEFYVSGRTGSWWVDTEDAVDMAYSDETDVRLDAYDYLTIASEEDPELSFQWYLDTADADSPGYEWQELEGETDSYLDVPAELGWYKCEVYDPDGNYDEIYYFVHEDGYDPGDEDDINEYRFSGDAIEGTIELGDSIDVSIEDDYDYASLEFTPEESGWYFFYSSGDEDTYGRVLDNYGDEIAYNDDYDDENDRNFGVNFYAEAGETYYLQGSLYGPGTGSFTVDLAEGEAVPEITGISVIHNGGYKLANLYGSTWELGEEDKAVYYGYFHIYDPQIAFNEGDKVRVQYKDSEGSYSVDYTYGYDDKEDEYTFVDEDGNNIILYTEWVDEQNAAKQFKLGETRSFRFCVYDEDYRKIVYAPKAESVRIEDNDFPGTAATDGAIGLNASKSIDATKGKIVSYAFTPSVDGNYCFKSSGNTDPMGRVIQGTTVIDRMDDIFTTGETDNYNFEINFTAKAGVTYILQARLFDDGVGSFTVTLGADPATVDRANAKARADAASKAAAAAKAADLAKTKPGTVATVGGATVKVITNVSGSTPGTVVYTKAPNRKKVTVPATVAINGKTFKVVQIASNAFKAKKIRTVTVGANVNRLAPNAFKGSKATKMILKTKLLKKAGVRKSLKGSKIKTIQVKVGSKKVNKKFVKSYKKIFTKKIAGKKATVK